MKIERSSFSSHSFHTVVLFLAVSSLTAFGQVNVLTQHNDNGRTGANLNETILTPSNVNVNGFGKLFTNSVDGPVYAQPLYVANLSIGGGTHNVVFVATENNSVYAFDANTSGVTYWHKNFGTPFSSGCSDLTPVVGITGTPVIDLSSNTLYVDTKLASGPAHQLHALSLFDGSEKFGGPVTVSASGFSASLEHQRPGLLLMNGVVYVAYGSHCDGGAYHGFLMSFDAGTLSHLHTLNTTSSGSQGAIWQSGTGPAADSNGNIYFITGNGSWDGSSNFGESYVKVSGSLAVLDFFTPSNWSSLNSGDTDLGAGGAVLVPPHFIVGLGKDGNLHLVDQNGMGHLGGGLQSFSAASGGDTTGMSPVYWQGPSKQYIFVSHSNSPTKSFEFTGSSINTTPLGTSSVTQNDRAGGISLSANGTSNGILWAIDSDSKVRAYDAVNFPTLLWDSGQNSSRDAMGTYVKFVAPTIANSKVYIATQNSLVVYGLLGGPPPAPTNLTATAGDSQVVLSWTASSGATNYHVKRATVSGGPYTTVGSPTSTSFTDTGLTNGTTYFYVVTAVSSAGESGNSSQASAKPQAGITILNTIADSFVQDGTFANTNFGTATVLKVKTNSTQTSVNRHTFVKFDISTIGTVSSATLRLFGNYTDTSGTSPITAHSVTDNSWTDSVITWNNQPAVGGGLSTTSVGLTAQYWPWDVTSFVQSQKSAGQTVVSIELQDDVDVAQPSVFNSQDAGSNVPQLVITSSPPPAPTNLTATAGNARVSLSWTASSGTTSYNVKRATVSGGPYTTVGSPTATSFTDTGLTNGTTYFYVVTAVNSVGESGNSNQASATPQAGMVTAISINFVGNGVTPMGSTESAGVVAKTNWNNAVGVSGTGQALHDETGAATSATLTWASDHLTSSGITDTAGNFRMMRGSVNTSNTSTTTITVSGLASGSYLVYLYFNENTFGASRTSAYTISGTGITTTTINGTDTAPFSGTFTQANNSVGNYVRFAITATGFTVTAKPVSSTDTFLRAPVNGIQIIPQ